MEEHGDNRELSLATWKNLVKLTAENVSPDRLNTILREILNVHALDDLSEQEAQELMRVLSPVANIKPLVWEAVVEAVTSHESGYDRLLSKVDGTTIADIITPHILDKLSHLFVANHKQELFGKPTPPPEGV